MSEEQVTPTPENPIPDVDDIKPGIPTPAWADEGGDLPAVTSQDAGKVLTVSDDGEWVAAQSGGGGGGGGAVVYVASELNEVTGTWELTKTWQEAADLIDSGVAILTTGISNATSHLMVLITGWDNEDGYVLFANWDESNPVFEAEAATDKPYYTK